MPNSILPTQLGYTAPGSTLRSQIYLGKNVNADFEAVGVGADGRPDALQALKIHLTKEDGTAIGAIYLDVTDIITLKEANSNIPTELFLKLVEVSVCEINDTTQESEEKKMVVLGSPTYAAVD